jgi:hypothetical protein
MSGLSRRGFLQASAGVAAGAAVGVPALADAAGAAGNDARASADELAGASSDPMIIYVENAGTGDVTILTGTDEIASREPELVARALRATRKAKGK